MENPVDIAKEAAEILKSIYGDELVSVILYGSAAGKDYVSGKSSVDLLVVLTDQGINKLALLFPHLKLFRKKRITIPLLLTEQFIKTSLDTFPVEFLNMKLQYKLITGKDVLFDLAIDRSWLRTQCERELKGKLLYLRQGFVETEGKAKPLRLLIFHSLKTFLFLFNALIYLKDREIPKTRREKIHLLSELFDINEKVFMDLLDVYEEKTKPDQQRLERLVLNYIEEMTKLSRKVDALTI
ncbi:MAG: hypothetical protein DRG83_14445 [Deltaproteobacteria bacterium]|nr:MAG: hypothetical protein DRG83_14445 [Deltaproteobacteria bacterium]